MSNSKSGFTLLEMLMALMITSLIIHGLHTCFMTYKNKQEVILSNRQIEWEQFLIMMDKELNQFTVDKVESQTIYLHDSRDRPFLITLKQGKILKTPGHHPYLYGVETWFIETYGDSLLVGLELNDGQRFYGRFHTRMSYIKEGEDDD